jgi:hypothetical protein
VVLHWRPSLLQAFVLPVYWRHAFLYCIPFLDLIGMEQAVGVDCNCIDIIFHLTWSIYGL